ncbi:MarR family transcriptional regulator [Halocynthiibacter sp.]|uniref:MarR family transcriptional regulator n=1 Tax=Halocynthiibacter sp. TaxID=1979210 RepID=UPI003C33433A
MKMNWNQHEALDAMRTGEWAEFTSGEIAEKTGRTAGQSSRTMSQLYKKGMVTRADIGGKYAYALPAETFR